MKGNNTLIVNTATMMQAMQEWLDKRTVDVDVEVTNVVQESQPSGTFRVILAEREQKG